MWFFGRDKKEENKESKDTELKDWIEQPLL